MVIECLQRKIMDLKIEVKPESGPGGCAFAAPVIKPVFQGEEVDPFSLYRTDARSNDPTPHHAFANMTEEKDLLPFFRKFGFPRYEGRDLLV